MNQYNLLKLVTVELFFSITTLYPETKEDEDVVEVTPATSEKFGHYQCNSAMKLAKILKKSPRNVAEEIVGELKHRSSLFEKIEIAGPGFINLTIKSDFLEKRLGEILKDPKLGITLEKKKRILVEFSSPNVAKEMHVGHLRSTIIGDAIARLFEFMGHDVKRVNHIGDWGTAFGMLIAYMQKNVPSVLTGEQKTDLPSLMAWYKASKKLFDEDEAFKVESRLKVVALQSGDPSILHAWEIICEISRKAYNEVYALLDVKIEEKGESFYNPMLPSVVKDLEDKGLVTVSHGAKCIFHEGLNIPLMIQKSDGGYNYDTTDMAAIKYRVETEKADRIIVLTDSGQALHFQLVYATALKAGYIDPAKVRFDHVTFGLVLGSDGKKFKTRSGDTEKLIDLLVNAINEAKNILSQREHDMAPKEVEKLSYVLGIDAVKYADLSSNRSHDYVFSYERMLRFEGNTAAFILYSYVRVAGIKRKAGMMSMESLIQKEKIVISHASEVILALHLLQFGETVDQMAEDLYPHHLTDYLYNLAQKFNVFFRDCQVVGSKEEASRLLLCEAVFKTMESGLHILGLQTVERM
jgi:arginyl-tRNA synthetase